MEFKTLLFEVKDHVAYVTLNRPEMGNGLNHEMAQDLMQAFLCCDEDPDIRAVLFRGAGKTFSVGGDITFFAANLDHLSTTFKSIIIYINGALARMAHMDAPIVSVAHGNIAGGGISLLSAADIVVAAESATFTPAYTAIGLSPDAGYTYFLPRLVGMRRALDLTLTNRRFTAAEALDWGLVSRVVPDDQVFEQAEALAVQLACKPTKALGATKRLLREGWTVPMETQLEMEGLAVSKMTETDDFRRSVRAFIERRSGAAKPK